MNTIEIIFLIIAIAFAVLVVFLAYVSVATYRAFTNLAQLTSSLKRQVDDLGHSPRTLINHANEISGNIHHKMKCLDPMFHSISNIGKKFEANTSKYKEIRIEDHSRLENMTELLDLVLKGINLIQKNKRS